MGLEKLLRGLYGSVPYLNLDLKLARARVPQPVTFDFKGLAEGVKKNNLGLGGITVQAESEFKDGRVILRPTGQSFPFEGAVPGGGAAWRKFSVLDWADPARTRLAIR